MTTMRECVDVLASEIGARPAGTDEEQKAALYLEETLKSETNFNVELQEFDAVSNPEIYRMILSAVMLVSGIFAFALPSFAIIWVLLIAIAGVLFVLNELDVFSLSRYLSKVPSQNVIAKRMPDSNTQSSKRSKKIILLTNYDSEKCKKEQTGSLINYIRYIHFFELVAVALLLIGSLIMLFSADILFAKICLGIGIVGSILPVVAFVVHTTAEYNEGANNNAASVAVMLEVAKRISTGVYAPGGDTPIIRGRQAAEDAGVMPSNVPVEWESESQSASADSYVASLFYDKSLAEGYSSSADEDSFVDQNKSDINYELDNLEDSRGFSQDFTQQITANGGLDEAEINAGTQSFGGKSDIIFDNSSCAALDSKPAVSSAPDWFTKGLQKAEGKGNLNADKVKKSRFGDAIGKAEAALNEATADEGFSDANLELQARLKSIQSDIETAGATASAQVEKDVRVANSVIDNEISNSQKKENAVEVDPSVTLREVKSDINGNAYIARQDTGRVSEHSDSTKDASLQIKSDLKVEEMKKGGVSGFLSSTTSVPDFETSQNESDALIKSGFVEKRDVYGEIPALRPLEPEYGVEVDPSEFLESGQTRPLETVEPSLPEPQARAQRDIKLPSLTGALKSKDINEKLAEREAEKKAKKEAVNRLGVELPSLTTTIEPVSVSDNSTVSNVGAFAVGEATGAFDPITDEDLMQANQTADDLYIYDADDASLQEEVTESGAVAGPGYVDIPDTHAESIFGKLFHKKKNNDVRSFSETIGVDDSWEARKVGKDRGDWSSFNDDDDWNGGAVIVSGDDRLPSESEERDAIYQFSTNDISAEVWCVALGSECSSHSGLTSFFNEHKEDLKGSIFVTLDAMGAGDLSLVESEGLIRSKKSPARMKRQARNAGKMIGKTVGTINMNWANTTTSILAQHSFKCIHVAGALNGKPAYLAEMADAADAVEDEQLQQSADLVMEIVRSI